MRYFIVCLLVSLAFSCNDKEDLIVDSRGNDSNDKRNKIQSGFQFDSIGIYHNLILDEFISNVSEFDNNCDSAAFMNTFHEEMANALCTIGYDVPTSNCDSLTKLDVIAATNIFSNYFDYSLTFQQPIAFNEVKVLLSYLKDSNETNIDTALAFIQTWTEDVYNTSTTYTSSDKDKLLKCGSIAYYSTIYWRNVSINPNSPWHNELSCGMGKKGNKTQFVNELAVAFADVSGFMCCGPVGAVTGSGAMAIWVYWGEEAKEVISDVVDFLFGWCC